jgi:hypothetical protein
MAEARMRARAVRGIERDESRSNRIGITTGRPSTAAWMVCEAKRLKQLEDENAKLKKLLAEQMLDAAALRELLSKKL